MALKEATEDITLVWGYKTPSLEHFIFLDTHLSAENFQPEVSL
jgi:hypothetical protein